MENLAVIGSVIRGWALTASALLLLTCGSAPAPANPPQGDLLWAAPTDPMQLAVNAGLAPEKKETLIYHVHAHLDVFVDGKRVIVPAGIGIAIQDPGVHKFDYAGTAAYGGIQGCSQPCISPLHTHDRSGVIHTESADRTPNRLGAFFTEWNVALTPSCVAQYCQPATSIAIYVNGQHRSGDPAGIALTDREEIAVVVGAPPTHIPAEFPSDAPV
jgi:hypothetical protein